MLIWILLGSATLLALIFIAWAISTYNRLVAGREGVKAGWAQIDVLLKRRHDLIPNLVETVKGYASHESKTLEAVIAARGAAVSSRGDAKQASAAEGQLSGALGRLLALQESYPDLKANSNFMQLQTELASTEGMIATQRNSYNNGVQGFNTEVQQFPTNILAGIFGFATQPFFEIQDPVIRDAPKVQF
jgi:LemA protein